MNEVWKLTNIYNGFDDKHILEFAASAAACNLFAENSVDGMLGRNEIEKISGSVYIDIINSVLNCLFL